MNIAIKPIAGRRIKKVKEIYMNAFPKEERMPFWLMRIMAKGKRTEFLSFYDQNILCGFVYMATIQNLTFVMFLAVEERLRAKGYGSKILDRIQAKHPGNQIVISIESCETDAKNQEQRIRRKNFYIKNGFAETGYCIELSNQIQEVLIKNGTFDANKFASFFQKYSNGAMRPKLWKAGNRGGAVAKN